MLLTLLLACNLDRPDTPFCHKLAGVEFAKRGDYRQAEPHFQRACAQDPQEPDACYFQARALYALDRFQESLEVLSKRARTTVLWKHEAAIGQALDALNQPLAETHLRRALKLRSQDPSPPTELDPLLALSAFLYRQGRAVDSLKLLESAPNEFQSLATYCYQLGRAHLAAQNPDRALSFLTRATQIQPRYSEAHGLLSRAYFQLGNEKLAAHHAERAKRP
jgi:tetratricopeptide (TPR) repeat protein